MDGTHRPINKAESFSPLNHSASEKISERIAETIRSLSAVVNFLNMECQLNTLWNSLLFITKHIARLFSR